MSKNALFENFVITLAIEFDDKIANYTFKIGNKFNFIP